ncbi:TetR/AcrR family transcriptional regulator [Bacillus subtilis]
MSSASFVDPDEAARAARTRSRNQQLLSAAARLMEREGFSNVSMQALATEAGVSVGLIYRYFGGKHDLLLATILGIVDDLATRIPAAVLSAGPDPVERLAAGFRAYCEVVDSNRHAAMVTYRESRSLDDESRSKINRLEIETSEPLRVAICDGIAADLMKVADVDLAVSNLMLMAHSWALKNWYHEREISLDEYIRSQTGFVLRAIVEDKALPAYTHLV